MLFFIRVHVFCCYFAIIVLTGLSLVFVLFVLCTDLSHAVINLYETDYLYEYGRIITYAQ